MTKDQMKKYLEKVIEDIRSKYVKTQEALQDIQKKANSEWTTVYSIPVHMTPEQQEATAGVMREAANQLLAAYREDVEKLVQEATDTIAAEKKVIIQALTAAEPVPTDVQLRMAEQIKKEYGSNGNALSLDRVKQFESDMNYHVDNETVKGYPYYLVAVELFPGNAEILDEVYAKLFPAIPEKKAALADVEECERFFKTAVIIHKFDTISNPTEADQLEMIRMKQELAELGAIDKLSQRVIRYA